MVYVEGASCRLNGSSGFELDVHDEVVEPRPIARAPWGQLGPEGGSNECRDGSRNKLPSLPIAKKVAIRRGASPLRDWTVILKKRGAAHEELEAT